MTDSNIILSAGELRVADGLQVVVRNSASFELRIGTNRCRGGPHTFEILHAFAAPVLAKEVIEKLGKRAGGAQDWILLTSTILNFFQNGVLIDAANSRARPRFSRGSDFAAAPVHIAMLDDRHRTQTYLDAIAAVVKPGDVVVDLGTGTGVLAVAAAKAGASRVYAIEETRIGDLARQVFQVNGLSDIVQLVEGHSTQISLPERADVLVSEIIGNDPFGERVLESMGDAVARLLKPQARLIPDHLSVYAAPVEIPAKALDKWRVSQSAVDRWQDSYGIDFAPLAAAARQLSTSVLANPADLAQWPLLAEAELAFDFSLAAKLHAQAAVELEFQVVRAGRCDGVALWFALRLGPGIELNTDPCHYRKDNHWRNLVWCFAEPVELAVGDRLAVSVPNRSDSQNLARVLAHRRSGAQ